MAAPIGVTTNVGALRAQHYLGITAQNLQQSIARLSSGKRLLSAADDAAGVAVSSKLDARIAGLNQAKRNANDGIAMLQTAESAYQQINDIMGRMRELAVQAANDTLKDGDRAYLNEEFTQLISEIDRLASVTDFNGIKLLDGTAGSSGTVTFQVGADNSANDHIQVTLSSTKASDLGVDALTVDTLANAQSAITTIDSAIDTLATQRATLGAKISHLQKAAEGVSNAVQNLSEARSNIADVDVAEESANLVKSQVLMQAGVAMLSQANQTPNYAVQLLRR